MAYIERESAIKSLLNDCLGQVSYSREDAADCIRYMEAADVAPVVHSRWIHDERMLAVCLECGMTAVEDGTDYCPNCGAKMDLNDLED